MIENKTARRISDTLGIICLLIGAGVLIRTACFVYSPDIWFDELFTVELAAKPLPEMISLAARDVHPPLYYILVRLVYITAGRLFGLSVPAAAKITSVIPYFLVIPYLLVFIRKKHGLLSCGFAFLLIQTMPQMSAYMVEARMYSWSAFVLMAMYIHASEVINRKKTMLHMAAVLLYGCSAMYLHYYAFIGAVIIAFGLLIASAVSRQGRNVMIPVVICMIIAAVSYIPWLKVLLGQIGQVSLSYWIQPVTLRTVAGCAKYVFRPEFESAPSGYACAAVMIIGYVYSFIKCAFNKQMPIKVPGTAVLPLGLVTAGVIASVLIRPVFVYRYLIPAMFVFWLGAGIMISHVLEDAAQKLSKKPVSIAGFACVLIIVTVYIISGIRSYNLFRWEENRKAEGMRAAEVVFEDISEQYRDRLIVCNFNQVQALMWYYLDNDSVLWGSTDETLIAEICDRYPIIMTDDPAEIKRIVSERGQDGFLFFGSGNARDEIIGIWESNGMFTKLLQDSCFLERYWFNIYEIGLKQN